MSLLGFSTTLLQTPVTDERTGRMTRLWQQFFEALFLRVGQADALTNDELFVAIQTIALGPPQPAPGSSPAPVDTTAVVSDYDPQARLGSLEQRVTQLEVVLSTVGF